MIKPSQIMDMVDDAFKDHLAFVFQVACVNASSSEPEAELNDRIRRSVETLLKVHSLYEAELLRQITLTKPIPPSTAKPVTGGPA